MSQRNFKMSNPNNETDSYFLREFPHLVQPQIPRGFNQGMRNQSTQTKTSPSKTANKSTQTEPVTDDNVQARVIAMLTGLDSILDLQLRSRSPSSEEHQRLNEMLTGHNCVLLREVLESRKRRLPADDLTGLLTTILERNPDGKPLPKRQKPERQEEASSEETTEDWESEPF
ncbi:uncharacterized protein LOC117147942 [Drosophila mauritiana]|uniref:Uncharacterized protein LOC117147942 n=1 Tax=Drosophila mauritiana TaxID=7226 RepID=A0A6P8KPI2_DROMA|nr:uncharacterized protein LOC117147942 [Drosophila mauritiana]